MEKAKVKGKRGSWFATVNGESLPCVHKHWWVVGATKYNDTGLKPSDKATELVEAIHREKRVILTSDVPGFDKDGNLISFERSGYIAVYSVDDIELDEAGLRFNFKSRIQNLS